MQIESQMNTIKVKLMGDIAGAFGKRELDVEFPHGASVGLLLKELCFQYGESFSKEIFNAAGGLMPTLLIFVNGDDIKELQGLDTPVCDNKVEVIVLPIFEGG